MRLSQSLESSWRIPFFLETWCQLHVEPQVVLDWRRLDIDQPAEVTPGMRFSGPKMFVLKHSSKISYQLQLTVATCVSPTAAALWAMSDLDDESLSSGSNTPPNQQPLPDQVEAGLSLGLLSCLEESHLFWGFGELWKFGREKLWVSLPTRRFGMGFEAILISRFREIFFVKNMTSFDMKEVLSEQFWSECNYINYRVPTSFCPWFSSDWRRQVRLLGIPAFVERWGWGVPRVPTFILHGFHGFLKMLWRVTIPYLPIVDFSFFQQSWFRTCTSFFFFRFRNSFASET